MYLQERLHALDNEDGESVGAGRKRRKFSQTPEEYMQLMRPNMQELAHVGVAGPDSTRLVVAAWKSADQATVAG